MNLRTMKVRGFFLYKNVPSTLRHMKALRTYNPQFMIIVLVLTGGTIELE